MNSIKQNKSINKKKTIRQQFDLQADKFSNWSVTRNLEYMQQYAEKGSSLLFAHVQKYFILKHVMPT